MRPARTRCRLAGTGIALALAAATPLAARTLAAPEIVRLVEPAVREMLAARAMALVTLEAGDATWEVPDGAITARVRRPQAAPPGVNLAAIDLVVDLAAGGVPAGSRPVRLAATAAVPVLVATGSLAPGEVLAGKVRVETRTLDGPTAGLAAASDGDLGGLRPRRPIAAGTVLRAADLHRAAGVHQGDRIEVQTRAGGVALRSPATALASGGIGDLVSIRVFPRGRAVAARVIAPGAVEVEPEGGSR